MSEDGRKELGGRIRDGKMRGKSGFESSLKMGSKVG